MCLHVFLNKNISLANSFHQKDRYRNTKRLIKNFITAMSTLISNFPAIHAIHMR